MRKPCRIPDDNSKSSGSKADSSADQRIALYAPKDASKRHPGAKTRAPADYAEASEPRRGLTPIPPKSTYQRDYEIFEDGEMQEVASVVSAKSRGKAKSDLDDVRSHCSRRSHHSSSQVLDLASVHSGQSTNTRVTDGADDVSASVQSSPLTARNVARMEAIEEVREQWEKFIASPRGKRPQDGHEPIINPNTGGEVRPKHRHLYLPLQQQLKRLVPDLTPVTSVPATDRSHYSDASERAAKYAVEHGLAAASKFGAATAREWHAGPGGGAKDARAGTGKDVRVRLLTTKMMRARPIGSEAKTGEEILNEITEARQRRSAAAAQDAECAAAAKAPTAGQEAPAGALERGCARSEKQRPRGLGQREFARAVRHQGPTGWMPKPTGMGWGATGGEVADKTLKSRGVTQGGAHLEVQLMVSPSLLLSRLNAQDLRRRRRARLVHVRDDDCKSDRTETAKSPCARAYASIQTDTMMGYDYRVVNGLVPHDGQPWRFTPPPKPYTPPTPVLLRPSLAASPRALNSHTNVPLPEAARSSI
jgi:hypothetical protein